MDKIRFYIGEEYLGESHRFGMIISFEETGVFFIIHFNKSRRWLGLGTKPTYLNNLDSNKWKIEI